MTTNEFIELKKFKDAMAVNETKCLVKYIEFLKLHQTEELTDDEKAIITSMKDAINLDRKLYKKKKIEYLKRDALDKLRTIDEIPMYYSFEEHTARTADDKPQIEKCKCCDEPATAHDIVDCPANCCGTEDGECIR